MQRKILIYGENWDGTLADLLNNDLKKRNIETDIFDFTNIMPGIRKRTLICKIKRRIFFWIYEKRINKSFLDSINLFKPNLVIVIKGLNLNISTLIKIKNMGIMLINWNPDDFFNMKNSSKRLIKSIKLYDVIASSREHLFEKYFSFGAIKMVFIDWYFVPDLHFSQYKNKTIKLSFVGSWSKYREKFIDSIGQKFVVRGGGWEKSSLNFKKKHDVRAQILTQREMSNLFDMSQINLNILTPDNGDLSNLRFFEVPASGGMLLTERNQHSLLHLLDRKECLMYSSIEEIRELLTKQFNYTSIARAGMKRIKKNKHKFHQRVDTLLTYIQ